MTETNSPVDLEMVIRYRQIVSLRSKLKKTRRKERIRHKLNDDGNQNCTLQACFMRGGMGRKGTSCLFAAFNVLAVVMDRSHAYAKWV